MDKEKSILEKIPTAIAVLSTYSILTAVTFNYGYFSVFGLNYLSLLSISDHVQNALFAMPFCFAIVLLFIFLTIFIKKTHQTYKIAFNISVILAFVVTAYFFYRLKLHFFIVIGNFVSLGTVLYYGSALWAAIIVFESRKHLSDKRLLIAFIPFSLSFPLSLGDIRAFKDLTKPILVDIYINNHLYQNSRILRYLERGALIYSGCNNNIELISWEHIHDIKYIDRETSEIAHVCPTPILPDDTSYDKKG